MATQTSYSRSLQEQQVNAMRNKLSVVAQARPVIVGAQEAASGPFAQGTKTDCLSERLQASLRLASHHIEDETLIEKQNAANQMRQAAIASAAANQQRQQQSKPLRLSATERLALTAKRPHEQAAGDTQRPFAPWDRQQAEVAFAPPLPAHQRSQSQVVLRAEPALAASSSVSSSKLTPMPTLETLLAVQRQLQRHTRQNLTPTQEQPAKEGAKDEQSRLKLPAELSERQQFPNLTKCSNFRHQEQNNHYVTAAPRPQAHQQHNEEARQAPPQQPPHHPLLAESYDKELPPLPASASPSSYGASSSDDSQLNSLDSQSSPATSLVSLPPPPPPLCAYLQQYDEAASSIGDSSNHSRSSTSPPASAAEMHNQHQHQHQHQQQQQQQQQQEQQQHQHQHQHTPPPPIKSQFAQIPLKQHAQHQQPASQLAARRAVPMAQVALANRAPPPPLAPRPAHLTKSSSQPATIQSFALPPPPAPLLGNANGYSQQIPMQTTRHQSAATSQNKQHLDSNASHSSSSSAASFEPLPPPPPPPIDSQPSHERPQLERQAAFDEPDCVAAPTAAFRFPTPPPPELPLFEHDEEDDEDLGLLKKKLLAANGHTDQPHEDEDSDFQCRIPTPPPGHQSACSSANFANFHQDLSAQSGLRSEFCASAASMARHGQQHQVFLNQQQRHQFSFQRSPVAGAANQDANQQLRSPLSFSSSGGTNFPLQPPALFQLKQQQSGAHLIKQPPSEPQLTVRVLSSDDEAPGRLPSGGLLSAKQTEASGLALLASSSSPSCSSDGDGQSSNSSSSTSGVHSSIESPLSDSASRLSSARELNLAHTKLASRKLLTGATQCGGPLANTNASGAATIKRKQPAANLKDFLIQRPAASECLRQKGHELARGQLQVQRQQQQLATCAPLTKGARRNSNSSLNSIASTAPSASGGSSVASASLARMPARPALKQKKSVHFSDKIEMVACAEEQCETHLPNPLLARVLAAGRQQWG